MSLLSRGEGMRGSVAVLLVLGLAGHAGATVTLTASKADTLYSADTDFDCGDLARTADADLPSHVIRLTAEDTTGQATEFKWSLPKPNVGFLMPDDPTIDSSAGGAFAVQGFCAEVGSGCVLTKDGLKAYRRSTILWAGPTCDEIPNKTRSQFDGDLVTFKVKGRAGKRGVGKGSVQVGYGTLGTPLLLVGDADGGPNGGLGQDRVDVGAFSLFSLTLDPSITPPSPIDDYFFDNGGGNSQSAVSCAPPPGFENDAPLDAAACRVLEYRSAGKFTARGEVRLEDGGAYCDKLRCRVGTCRPKANLKITRSPKKQTYKSPETASITVTLHNNAPKLPNGCDFRLASLECTTQFKLGNLEESATTTFRPAQCEKNELIGCATDDECISCGDGECIDEGPCLASSYCSATTSQPCSVDADCDPQRCTLCDDGESCIRVIPTVPIINPGESAVLIDAVPVELKSVLAGKAKVTETWTVGDVLGRGDDTAEIKYKIKGQPVQ